MAETVYFNPMENFNNPMRNSNNPNEYLRLYNKNKNTKFNVENPLIKQISLFRIKEKAKENKTVEEERRKATIVFHIEEQKKKQSNIRNSILDKNIDNILKPGKDLFDFFKKYTDIYYTKVKNVYNPKKTYTSNLLKPFLKMRSSFLPSKKKTVYNFLKEKQDEINNNLENLINEYFDIEKYILKLSELKRSELLLDLSIKEPWEKKNKSSQNKNIKKFQNQFENQIEAYIRNEKFEIIEKLIIKYIHNIINAPANYNKTILGKLRYLQDKYKFMHRNFTKKYIDVKNLEFKNIIDSSIMINNICIFAWNTDINKQLGIDYKMFNRYNDLLTLYKSITNRSISQKDLQKFSNIFDKKDNFNNNNNLNLEKSNKIYIKDFIAYIKIISFNNPLSKGQYINLKKEELV